MGSTAATGFSGRILWNNTTPVAGHSIQIREWVIFDAAVYASGTTDANGRFTITGVPVKGNLGVHHAEQSAYNFVGYGAYTSCGDRIVDLGDFGVLRTIAGLSITQNGTVPAGPLTITWTPVEGATGYCVYLYNSTDGASMTPGTCAGGSPRASTATTSYTTPPLVSGKRYSFSVFAHAGDGDIAALSAGNVNINAD